MVISDTRYQLSLFAMFDYESVEKRLEKMAAKGWEIENTGTFFWKYRRTTPQKKNCAIMMDGKKRQGGSKWRFFLPIMWRKIWKQTRW